MDEVASLHIRHAGKVRIIAIDGREAEGLAFYLEPKRQAIWVLVHEVMLEDMMEYTVKRTCRIVADYEPGKRYEVHFFKEKVKSTAAGSEIRLAAKVVRVEDGRAYWPHGC